MSVTASSSSSTMYDGGAPHPASLLMSLKADRGTLAAAGSGSPPAPLHPPLHPTTTALAAAAAAAAAAESPTSSSPASSRAPKGDLVEFFGEDRCGSCCRANKQVCVALLKNGNRRRTCSQCQRDKKACDKYERYDSDGKLITKVQTSRSTNNPNGNATAASPEMGAAAVLSASPMMKPSGPLPVVHGASRDTTAATVPNTTAVRPTSPKQSPVARAVTGAQGRSPPHAQLAPPPTQAFTSHHQDASSAAAAMMPSGAPTTQTSPFHYHLWQPPASVNMTAGQQQQPQGSRPQLSSQSTSYQGSASSSVAATPPATSVPLAPIVNKSTLDIERMRNQLLGEVCDSMLSILNRWSADERDFSGPRQFVKRVTSECGTALRRPELLDRAKVNDITRKLESALKERQQALGGDDVAPGGSVGATGAGDFESRNPAPSMVTLVASEDAPPAVKRRRLSSDASGRGSVPSKRSMSVEEADSKPVRLHAPDDEHDELESVH
ncbi:hypothetical protein OIV83_001258 [Microbotryomycetes sp. JL201]|nr:hypothetical protein OIV83_001258 [Microbotryomycetes sp. JL201]